jgi:hypothetical protein
MQRNWQHMIRKAKNKKKNKNTTQYVLDTTIRKQQIPITDCTSFLSDAHINTVMFLELQLKMVNTNTFGWYLEFTVYSRVDGIYN